MSLSGAISAAVSALNAQSAALSLISNNLANSSTTAYKTSSASFASLLAGGESSGVSSGGVAVSGVANISEQGLLDSSIITTNVAIDGSGFFIAKDAVSGGSTYYTRNGKFAPDDDGYLVNNGYYLQGWKTDEKGNVIGGMTDANLQTIDIDSISTMISKSTKMAFAANLPANAASGDTFTNTVTIYDSLGSSSSMTVTWTKSATNNEWQLSFSDPVNADGTKVGTVGTTPITISFNSDGSLKTPESGALAITNWTNGAADSAISIDFGEAGATNGLRQFTTGDSTLTVELKVDQDGTKMGSLTKISIDEDGNVNALFDNGLERVIYKIPVSTFANDNGLTALSNGMYNSSESSGPATLHLSGENGAGIVKGGKVELSTTDTSTEFAKMIAAQQAYSGAAQVMKAASDMYDTLMSAIR